MKKLLHSTLATFLLAASASASTLLGVSWGGTGVATSSQTLSLGTASDTGGYRVWRATGSPMVAPSSSYLAQPFYGILQNQNGSSPQNFGTASVIHHNMGDYIDLRGSLRDAENPVDRSIAGLIYFKKEDFLNGLSTAGPLSFASDGQLSLTVRQLNSGGTRVGYLAVLNDGVWYLSTRFNGVTTVTLSNPTTANWAEWDPSSSPLPESPTLFNISGSTFTNIEAVGFYFFNSQPSSSANQPIFQASAFEASFAVPVPEPSQLLLLALGGGVALVLARKRSLA